VAKQTDFVVGTLDYQLRFTEESQFRTVVREAPNQNMMIQAIPANSQMLPIHQQQQQRQQGERTPDQQQQLQMDGKLESKMKKSSIKHVFHFKLVIFLKKILVQQSPQLAPMGSDASPAAVARRVGRSPNQQQQQLQMDGKLESKMKKSSIKHVFHFKLVIFLKKKILVQQSPQLAPMGSDASPAAVTRRVLDLRREASARPRGKRQPTTGGGAGQTASATTNVEASLVVVAESGYSFDLADFTK
jgi:hypothetical protein